MRPVQCPVPARHFEGTVRSIRRPCRSLAVDLSPWSHRPVADHRLPTAYFIATRRRTGGIRLEITVVWTNADPPCDRGISAADGVINTALRSASSRSRYRCSSDFAVGVGLAYVFLLLMVLPLTPASRSSIPPRSRPASIMHAGHRCSPHHPAGSQPGSAAACWSSYRHLFHVTARFMGGGRSLMIGNLIEHNSQQGRNWRSDRRYRCPAGLR